MEFDFSASKLNNMYSTLKLNDNSFLVYTTCTKTGCKLICTDTETFWCKDVDVDEINEELESTKLESKEKYIEYLSDNLLSSNVDLETKKGDSGEVLSLLIGNSPVLQLEFLKWSDANRDEELRKLLFGMAKHTSEITKALDRVKQGDGTERRLQSEYKSGMVMPDFNTKLQRGSAAPKIRRKPGMSVINPNSKKLKSEKGITFD